MSKLEHLQLRTPQLISFWFDFVRLDRVSLTQLYYFFAIQIRYTWLHCLSLALTLRTNGLSSRLLSKFLEDGGRVWDTLLTFIFYHRNELNFIFEEIDFSSCLEVWSFHLNRCLAVIDVRKDIVLVFIKFLDDFLALHRLRPGRFGYINICYFFLWSLLKSWVDLIRCTHSRFWRRHVFLF